MEKNTTTIQISGLGGLVLALLFFGLAIFWVGIIVVAFFGLILATAVVYAIDRFLTWLKPRRRPWIR